MTEHTVRLIIVMRDGFAPDANTAAKLVDTLGGEHTFSVRLRRQGDETNTPVARWCSWQMTEAEAQTIRLRLQERGLLDTEVVVVPKLGSAIPNVNARAYLFDASKWEPSEVLSLLKLDTLESELVPNG